jgi:hypothetical protein
MEVKDIGGLGVEDEADWVVASFLLLEDHARHVVTMTELIAEALTFRVEEDTTLTTESLGSQKLPLGTGILGVDETSWMNLDLIHINGVGANLYKHLLAVTSSVLAVGGSEIVHVGSVLLEKGAVSEIGSVTTSSEDDWALDGILLAIKLVDDAYGLVALLVDLGNAGLLDQLGAFGLLLGQLLETLHERIGDGHTGKFGIMTTVSTGFRVTTAGTVRKFL